MRIVIYFLFFFFFHKLVKKSITEWFFYSFLLKNVLAWAGVELIFFTMLVWSCVLGLCWKQCWDAFVNPESQGLFPFSYSSAGEKTGDAWEVGRRRSQDSRPQLAKQIFLTILYRAQYINWGEGAGNGRTFGVVVFVFPGNQYAQRSPAFLGMSEHGKCWINFLFCLVCMCRFCFTS